MSESHQFSVSATWNEEKQFGRVKNSGMSFDVEHRGATAFGGPGGGVNPEELLIAAVATCFAHTWGIFVKKLGLTFRDLEVDAKCVVEPDPAGGYRVTEIALAPRVAKSAWESEREKVEKTLKLAEKYCIVSKAVRSERLTLSVTPNVV